MSPVLGIALALTPSIRCGVAMRDTERTTDV